MAPKSERPHTRAASGSSARLDTAPYQKPPPRPSRRNTAVDGEDSEGTSGGPHHVSHVRSTRQQYSACGACRMRRVKCDLKEMAVTVPSGGRPVCTNCAERQINCVFSIITSTDNDPSSSDEFSNTGGKPGAKQKLLRRGRRIQNAEATFGKADSPGEPASIIQEPSLEFFTSPFFLTFQVQRPILEPTEFSERYAAHVNGDTEALGPTGVILAKVLVTWAASFGHDHTGQPMDRGRSPFGADGLDLATCRAEWGAHVREMIDELLHSIDRHGVLRKPTWDGVRALMLLIPLMVDSSHAQLERLAMMEATLCQIYTLCSLAPPPLVGQDGELDILVRSRIFWSAYVSEGVTSGLRGGRLILDDEDLHAFQRVLPNDHSSDNTSLSHFSLMRSCSNLVLDISGTCRAVHRILTGPRVRQRLALIDEQSLKRIWDSFDEIWVRLEDARATRVFEPLHGDNSDRFISSWEIYIFEALNVIREVLKQRVVSHENSSMRPTSDTQTSHQQLIRLHDRALTICYAKLPHIMDLIRKYDPRGLNRHFFAYDASVSGDGCFFAAILLATGDSHRFGTTETELRSDIEACIAALRAMRWAFSKSEDRERSIEHEWERRRQRLDAHSPTSSNFPSGTYGLAMPSISPPAAGSAPPPLSIPVYRDMALSNTGWSSMSMFPHNVSTDTSFAYGSYSGTSALHGHAPETYQSVVRLSSPPGSTGGSRPSTGGGPPHDSSSVPHGLVAPYNAAHTLETPYYVSSPVETSAHMIPRDPRHAGLGIPLASGSGTASMLSSGLGQSSHHGYSDVDATASATSGYPQWHSMHIPGQPHH